MRDLSSGTRRIYLSAGGWQRLIEDSTMVFVKCQGDLGLIEMNGLWQFLGMNRQRVLIVAFSSSDEHRQSKPEWAQGSLLHIKELHCLTSSLRA
jgi:hypothetical protein